MRTYVDSSYFLDHMSADSNERRFACQVKDRIRGHQVIVPQIVLGEVMSVMVNKYKDDLVSLERKIRILSSEITALVDPTMGLPVIESKHLVHMDHFMNICKFQPTDATILSIVMGDPDSYFFITTDENLIGSGRIYDYELKLRNSGSRNETIKITYMP